MARAISTFLRIYSPLGTWPEVRFQDTYAGRPVEWESKEWEYLPMQVDGFVTGGHGIASLSVEVPAVGMASDAIEGAHRRGLLLEVRQYEWDSLLGSDAPQAGQALIALHLGEVERLREPRPTRLVAVIGSALAPQGAQVPPRVLTSELIGSPLVI